MLEISLDRSSIYSFQCQVHIYLSTVYKLFNCSKLHFKKNIKINIFTCFGGSFTSIDKITEFLCTITQVTAVLSIVRICTTIGTVSTIVSRRTTCRTKSILVKREKWSFLRDASRLQIITNHYLLSQSPVVSFLLYPEQHLLSSSLANKIWWFFFNK